MLGRAPARDSKQPQQWRSSDCSCDAAQKDREPLAGFGRGFAGYRATSSASVPAVRVGPQRPQSCVHGDVCGSRPLLCEPSNALDGAASFCQRLLQRATRGIF